MGIFNRLFGRSSERAITYATGVQAGLIQPPTYSGMPVTELTALGVPALLCGIKAISEAVGSLPPVLYRETPAGRDRANTHPLAKLLDQEPNPETTHPVLWETAQSHALLFGNAYLEIVRDGAGRPVELWNLHPKCVTVGRDSSSGKLLYRYTNTAMGGPPGPIGNVTILPAEDVLHVPGLSPDGSVGYQLLTVARETIGFSLATQRFGSSLFRNLGRPGGVIDVPPNVSLNEDGRENLKRSFRQETGGENVGSIVLMEQGIKFSPISLATNEQLQYKETVQFLIYEIARLLNIPPSKLWSLEKATWANLGELNRDFLITTLRPWLVKWEAEICKKLLLPNEKGSYYVEWDCTELLRTDQATRFANYSLAIGKWMTVNEVRAAENLPPVDGGDDLTPPAPPTPPPADDEDDATDDQGDDSKGDDDDA